MEEFFHIFIQNLLVLLQYFVNLLFYLSMDKKQYHQLLVSVLIVQHILLLKFEIYENLIELLFNKNNEIENKFLYDIHYLVDQC